MNNKGQTGGLITALVFGVASLVVAVIIAFVIISTLNDAELLDGGRTTSQVVNETGGFLNRTTYTLDIFNSASDASVAIDEAWNVTAATPVLIPAANFSLVATTGVVQNATNLEYPDVNFTYTLTRFTTEENATNRLSANYSAGIDNVSEQIPTVLLVAAIVLILAVLAILVGVWQRMRMGGGSTL